MESTDVNHSTAWAPGGMAHIISEAVIAGSIGLYFWKKISALEQTVQELQSQLEVQNNQLQWLIQQQTRRLAVSPLAVSPLAVSPLPPQRDYRQQSTTTNAAGNNGAYPSFQFKPPKTAIKGDAAPPQATPKMQCDNGVCKLVRPLQATHGKGARAPSPEKKTVSISKIAKQIEFEHDQIAPARTATTQVSTFSKPSPNPVLRSITPNPSIGEGRDGDESGPSARALDKILNDIDCE
ncbi:hypothetical protein MIV124R [Invertebrate iridescent virus 3]|uniref:Uncharacterized protein 124R n=1 Tax=Invertebrate iridescent virus 3 TaxID=345201 RepID=124R_IIV3|nr:hypothetical protein MIV124R [Invertebrate iridescent virus 3]Q196T6.1 RecName: Full=Uncharacterized protein 124R [Invertebrate iridescent virus 3]ABF82154.1 hypothetical protein MIV124R [Invertebrate iridescent virus 3]